MRGRPPGGGEADSAAAPRTAGRLREATTNAKAGGHEATSRESPGRESETANHSREAEMHPPKLENQSCQQYFHHAGAAPSCRTI